MDARMVPHDVQNSHLNQPWHITGTPIVDGKYVDHSTGEVKVVTLGDLVTAGPPAVELFWYNRNMAAVEGRFTTFAAHAFISVTEYMARLGAFFTLGSCELVSINATRYAVHVIVATELPQTVIVERMNRCNLFPALELE